jgi:hypothetical protein
MVYARWKMKREGHIVCRPINLKLFLFILCRLW